MGPSLKSINPEGPQSQHGHSNTPLRALGAQWRIYILFCSVVVLGEGGEGALLSADAGIAVPVPPLILRCGVGYHCRHSAAAIKEVPLGPPPRVGLQTSVRGGPHSLLPSPFSNGTFEFNPQM